MKILHTSDWHLGMTLYGQKRHEEFDATLDWLARFIQDEQIDTLLIAGDVFDNGLPNNRSQEQYYAFLARLVGTCCRNIIVTAGNHDSPSFLNAPKQLLRALNIQVVGDISDESPEEEVLVLYNELRQATGIVCAVPYLRDRDIRTVEADETVEMKTTKLINGIRDHYQKICSLAEQKRKELVESGEGRPDIPIIAMGHLFTVDGKTFSSDGVRELYVGTLTAVDETIFPPCIQYVALGHLHIPQLVREQSHLRYCGSLLPVGFDEAKQDKQVVVVDFNGEEPTITEHIVPRFQTLEQITGTMAEITVRIEELKKEDSDAWLEVVYTGKEKNSNLRSIIDELVLGSRLTVCRTTIKRDAETVLMASGPGGQTLHDLTEDIVFQTLLDSQPEEIPEEKREWLTRLYKEIVQSLHEQDVNAE